LSEQEKRKVKKEVPPSGTDKDFLKELVKVSPKTAKRMLAYRERVRASFETDSSKKDKGE
jgi:DNA uptake protein ComE-like DNA-binding protein